jgi:hypothetical protein
LGANRAIQYGLLGMVLSRSRGMDESKIGNPECAACWEPGGLSVGVAFGEGQSVNAEQARQDFRAVGSNRERSSAAQAATWCGTTRTGSRFAIGSSTSGRRANFKAWKPSCSPQASLPERLFHGFRGHLLPTTQAHLHDVLTTVTFLGTHIYGPVEATWRDSRVVFHGPRSKARSCV